MIERRGFRRGLLEVVGCSLLVTSAAAIVATFASMAGSFEWSVAFVIARWICVAILLVLPLLHQITMRAGVSWRLPWVLQTPATALLLTAESIAFDIISAQL